MSEMQIAGKKMRSTMEDIVIISAITEQWQIENINTYYLHILWLQNCIIELAKLGYNKNELEIYNLNKTVQIKLNAPYCRA